MRFSFSALGAESEEHFRRYISRLGGSGGAFLTHNLSGVLHEITENSERIGFVSTERSELEAFFVSPEYYGRAEEAFDDAIKALGITSARVLTCDSPLVSLCCARWKSVRPIALCYEYVGFKSEPDIVMSCALESDFSELENSGFFDPRKLEKSLRNHSVYVERETCGITAFGTADFKTGDGYGFVDVAVRPDKRMCGRGKAVLARLGEMLRDYGATALSQCSVLDTALSHTLESAGYVCYDKLLSVTF